MKKYTTHKTHKKPFYKHSLFIILIISIIISYIIDYIVKLNEEWTIMPIISISFFFLIFILFCFIVYVIEGKKL
jgi:predicted PurR-regulated permease PerM